MLLLLLLKNIYCIYKVAYTFRLSKYYLPTHPVVFLFFSRPSNFIEVYIYIYINKKKTMSNSKMKARKDRESLESRNKDLNVIKNILDSMNVEYDPAVMPQLLAYAYEHTADVLDRAQKLAVHAGRLVTEVRPSDVSLAIRSGKTAVINKNARSSIYTTKKIAADRVNSREIPRPSSTWGVYLPKRASIASVPLHDNYIVTVDDPETNDSKYNKNNNMMMNNTKTTTGGSNNNSNNNTNSKKRKAPDNEEIEAAFEKRPRTN